MIWGEQCARLQHAILTFHDLVEGTVRGHVLDDLDLERRILAAVLLVEECVHVVGLVGIANGATDAVAVLEKLFRDVTGDIPVHACDKDEGFFGDCWHCVHYSSPLPNGARGSGVWSGWAGQKRREQCYETPVRESGVIYTKSGAREGARSLWHCSTMS